MPILDIRALQPKEGVDIPRALKVTCCEVAKVFGCPPHQVWATWTDLKPDHYAEGENTVTLQPESTHPPIVRMVAFEGASNQTIEDGIKRAAEVLSRELKIPKNVFIMFSEAFSGRVFDGGEIVYKKERI